MALIIAYLQGFAPLLWGRFLLGSKSVHSISEVVATVSMEALAALAWEIFLPAVYWLTPPKGLGQERSMVYSVVAGRVVLKLLDSHQLITVGNWEIAVFFLAASLIKATFVQPPLVSLTRSAQRTELAQNRGLPDIFEL